MSDTYPPIDPVTTPAGTRCLLKFPLHDTTLDEAVVLEWSPSNKRVLVCRVKNDQQWWYQEKDFPLLIEKLNCYEPPTDGAATFSSKQPFWKRFLRSAAPVLLVLLVSASTTNAALVTFTTATRSLQISTLDVGAPPNAVGPQPDATGQLPVFNQSLDFFTSKPAIGEAHASQNTQSVVAADKSVQLFNELLTASGPQGSAASSFIADFNVATQTTFSLTVYSGKVILLHLLPPTNDTLLTVSAGSTQNIQLFPNATFELQTSTQADGSAAGTEVFFSATAVPEPSAMRLIFPVFFLALFCYAVRSIVRGIKHATSDEGSFNENHSRGEHGEFTNPPDYQEGSATEQH